MQEEEIMNIILADDDADDRLIFKKAIGELKLNVNLNFFKNGDEVVDYFNDQNETDLPHILFLDLNMPCLKYGNCLKKLRSISKLQDMTIAIYSTSNAQKDIDDTFIGGANIYIRKPSEFEVLKNSLREVLKINWQFHTSGLSKDTFLFSI